MVARNVVAVASNHSVLDAAERYVKSKGARRKIGEGCYGAVWASNEGKRGAGNRVYKVCNTRRNQGAYLAYADAVVDHLKGNPHVPRIYSIVEFKSEDYAPMAFSRFEDESSYTVICMEKLAPVGEPNGNPLHGCGYFFDSDEHFATMSMMDSAVRHGTNGTSFNAKLAAVVECIRDIRRETGACLDIHSGNVMLRGNTLVVTDPLS